MLLRNLDQGAKAAVEGDQSQREQISSLTEGFNLRDLKRLSQHISREFRKGKRVQQSLFNLHNPYLKVLNLLLSISWRICRQEGAERGGLWSPGEKLPASLALEHAVGPTWDWDQEVLGRRGRDGGGQTDHHGDHHMAGKGRGVSLQKYNWLKRQSIPHYIGRSHSSREVGGVLGHY